MKTVKSSSLLNTEMNFVLLLSTTMMILLLLLVGEQGAVAAAKSKSNANNINALNYSLFPRRTEEEAAVFEWGHSAIISALDASVAKFGPQTNQAALLEVECMPILASPVNGAMTRSTAADDHDNDNDDHSSSSSSSELLIQHLDNYEEVDGNIVVMTNNGGLSGVQMATIAKLSGAAALMVVNIDEKRQDDIYPLDVLEGEEEDAMKIDIPVVMISLNSANVLTSATVEPHMEKDDVVNNGMPERIRLYAGGDRPFFEDVETHNPTLYLIHNLLTNDEADSLTESAKSRVVPVTEDSIDTLQMNTQPENFPGVERVMLWQGTLASPAQKAIEERIEQVTGFPSAHFSDFIVDKLEPGAFWKPHYDKDPLSHYPTPIATIIVFLNGNGEVVYPRGNKNPIKIIPHKGLAIVHHNMNEKDELDMSTLHALLSIKEGGETAYVARKYVFETPVSNARRTALPSYAYLFGGKLPTLIVRIHDVLVSNFGIVDGGVYFDKACIFVPVLILIVLAQIVFTYLKDKIFADSSSENINDGSKEPSSSSNSNTTEKKKTSIGNKRKGKKGKND